MRSSRNSLAEASGDDKKTKRARPGRGITWARKKKRGTSLSKSFPKGGPRRDREINVPSRGKKIDWKKGLSKERKKVSKKTRQLDEAFSCLDRPATRSGYNRQKELATMLGGVLKKNA